MNKDRYIVRALIRKVDDPTFNKVQYMVECLVDGIYFVDDFERATIFDGGSDLEQIQHAMSWRQNLKDGRNVKCERVMVDEKGFPIEKNTVGKNNDAQ